MKSYYPYDPSSPRLITGEEHQIKNGQILLNHIPYLNSIEIDGFKQTSSANILPNQFFCAYGEEYYYREANCIVRFHQQHNGETVRVTYQQVGTIITANDMNEIKEHIENNSIHNRYEMPAASTYTRGGVRVGSGLSILGDVLSANAQNFTLTPASADSLGGIKVGSRLSITRDGVLSADALQTATNLRLGGVLVESDENISRTIERYFPSVPADTEILPMLSSIPAATRESIGGVIIGGGLSIDSLGVLSADTQNFTLTPATADSLGGVKVGSGLSIDANGVLSADSVEPYTLTAATADSLGGVKVGSRLSIDTNGILSADALQSATTSRLGGVFVESDENISRTIERYFPSVPADTEILPVLSSIPAATRESIGGVIIGGGLSIDSLGVLSADTQNFTLTPATADSLGGVKIGDGLSIDANGVLSADSVEPYTLPIASRDSLGGIMVGNSLTITNGVLNYNLPAASTATKGGVVYATDEDIATTIEKYFPTVSASEIVPVLTSIPVATADSLGGVKIGNGLTITKEGLLSADTQDFTLTPASADSLGGVKIGTTLTFTNSVLDYNLPVASSTTRGGIKIGKGLTMSGDTLNADAQDFTLKPATSSQLGGIKVGSRLSITADGILSADSIAPYTLPAASDEEISSMIEEYFPETLTPEPFTLPAATKTSLGGIIVGDRLSISNSGVLSANDQSYTLPTASTSTKGGVKVGKGLTMTGETLSANADNYTLPTASSSQLGGVKVGNTLSMSSSGVLNYNLPNATSAALGGVIAGNTLTITNGTLNYNLPTASASQLGGVKVGNGLTITNGVLSATATDLPVASDAEISAIIQNYFAYTVVGGA